MRDSAKAISTASDTFNAIIMNSPHISHAESQLRIVRIFTGTEGSSLIFSRIKKKKKRERERVTSTVYNHLIFSMFDKKSNVHDYYTVFIESVVPRKKRK